MGTPDAVCEVPPAGGEHGPAVEGHPQGARGGRRDVHPGALGGGTTSSVLVAPSLLLTTRDVAATVRQARGRLAVLAMPWRAAGYQVAMDPDAGFVTSPALGWTLVRVEGRGMPTVRLRRLAGLVLPAVSCGARTGEAQRWIDGQRISADVDLRLRVMGGRGEAMRRELGL